MTVQLSSNFEEFIRKLIESGRFDSEQEVIEAGVAKLVLENIDQSAEEIDDTTADEIACSEEQIRTGKVRSLDDAVIELRRKHFGK